MFSWQIDLLIGVGVSVALFRRGEAVGDGVAVGFFAEGFRCLRAGLGVGVGARIFLIFLPNDSSAAGPASTAPNKITSIRTHFITRCCSVRCPQRRFEPNSSGGLRCYSTWRSTGRMPASPTNKMPVLRLREFLHDCSVQTNAALEIFQRKVLVRRMSAAIGEGKSHE